MKINQVIITPEIAAAMLETNTMNRPLSMPHVRKLSDALLRGEWVVNGDAIRISSNGFLIDGQHR